MNDDPQIAARASSMGNGRRLTASETYPWACLASRLDSTP